MRGNRKYTDEAIIAFLEEQGVEHGMKLSNVDCDRIVKDIRKSYDEIIWVSASIEGCRLIVQIKENEDSEDIRNPGEETGPRRRIPRVWIRRMIREMRCSQTKAQTLWPIRTA